MNRYFIYKVYDYYMQKGFPGEFISNRYIINQFEKLIKYDASEVLTDDKKYLILGHLLAPFLINIFHIFCI